MITLNNFSKNLICGINSLNKDKMQHYEHFTHIGNQII